MSENKSPFGILDGTYKTSICWTGKTKEEQRKVKALNGMKASSKFVHRKIGGLNSFFFLSNKKGGK